MILSKRVALGGQQLDELHDAIVIRSIDPGVPNESISAVDRMGRAGSRITGDHFSTIDVSVTYAIDIPKRRMAERREVFDLVNAWANRKGWLTVNWLENRRLYVDKTILPGSGDMWAWTNEFTVVFRAYNVPFWQEELPVQAEGGTAASGRVNIQVNGTTESVLDVSFRNMSGMTINNLWIQANGNRITLTGLGLGGSSTLNIHHGTDGLLRIEIGSASVYHKYSGADDLYVNQGSVAVDYGADRAGILTVRSFGRWI